MIQKREGWKPSMIQSKLQERESNRAAREEQGGTGAVDVDADDEEDESSDEGDEAQGQGQEVHKEAAFDEADDHVVVR
jgi:hypothetical protein